MPPPRRRPATPPSRRPKVAGLHRRPDQDQDHIEDDILEAADPAETPDLDVPVIGEQPKPSPKRRDAGVVVTDLPETDGEPKHRKQDPAPAAGTHYHTGLGPRVIGKPEPDGDLDPPEAETGEEPGEEPGEEAKQPAKLTLPIVLVVVALLLGGLAFWFAQQLSDARVGSGNNALSDVNATKDVVGAAQQAVTNVLSYKFDDMQSSTARAKEYLDGEAVGQYEASMKALEKEIQDQKLQVVVNPVSIGVVRMAGDDARVLVFADQIGARADKQPSGGPTQFAMDMHRTNGKWKIVKLDFFENR